MYKLTALFFCGLLSSIGLAAKDAELAARKVRCGSALLSLNELNVEPKVGGLTARLSENWYTNPTMGYSEVEILARSSAGKVELVFGQPDKSLKPKKPRKNVAVVHSLGNVAVKYLATIHDQLGLIQEVIALFYCEGTSCRVDFYKPNGEILTQLPLPDSVYSVAVGLPRDSFDPYPVVALVQTETGDSVAHYYSLSAELIGGGWEINLKKMTTVHSLQGRYYVAEHCTRYAKEVWESDEFNFAFIPEDDDKMAAFLDVSEWEHRELILSFESPM